MLYICTVDLLTDLAFGDFSFIFRLFLRLCLGNINVSLYNSK